jgi:hypothetical protein
MTVTSRVTRLRQESLDAKASLSPQRARLLTDFYRNERSLESAPAFRARAFAYLLAHEELYLGEGELIAGEKGHAPKAAPTYPELCCHSLDDLALLDGREKIPFAVSDEVRALYSGELIPFWQGRSLRERLFAEMTPEWKAAYAAGILQSSWSSALRVTPSWTIKSTARACSISWTISPKAWRAWIILTIHWLTRNKKSSRPWRSPRRR